jgi:hypothetical protein
MNNSKYDPGSTSQFAKLDVNVNFQGQQFDPEKNTATNCDFKIVDDHLIDGGRIITTGVTLGDNIDAKVIDIDNVLGYGAGVVLKTFITAWPLYPGSNVWDFGANYPAKIFDGLYIRIVYHSVAETSDPSPKLLVGYRLHKVLW